MSRFLAALSSRQKKLILMAALGGGTVCGLSLRMVLQNAQRKLESITKNLETKNNSQERIQVDRTFLQRLLKIFSICVPSALTKEAALVFIHGALLVLRTLLTLEITKLEGNGAKYITTLNFDAFYRNTFRFAAISVPASFVNSGLKYVQKLLQIRFQDRLTKHLHSKYCSNRGYYTAAAHGSLTNADQRLTEDVDKFASSVTELYSYTFKPLLDVILFTRALAPTMGYKGQLAIYGYYIVAALILRTISPPLAKITAQAASLSGNFRSAHQRLSAHAEEVAYNDPPSGISEEIILNGRLQSLLRHGELSAFQKAVQQAFDGFLVKYMASAATLLVYALPMHFRKRGQRGLQAELTQDYVRSMRLLQNASRGIGDLILVYRRVSTLSAHTSRVAILMEEIDNLARGNGSHIPAAAPAGEDQSQSHEIVPETRPERLVGDCIRFDGVSITTPDGDELVQGLTFEVSPSWSVLIMGPNGTGKTSLMRTLAGLWPLQRGKITTPTQSEVFYLSQRAYLVTGTLRDQLIYPDPPRQIWAGASRTDKRRFTNIRGRGVGSVDNDRMLECIKAVELESLLSRGEGWNQQQNWDVTLSGGERQRIAIARLLYHRPRFAILDEATSSVNADGEKRLYMACKEAGIALLSIGHRMSLKCFHDSVITLGEGVNGWRIEPVRND